MSLTGLHAAFGYFNWIPGCYLFDSDFTGPRRTGETRLTVARFGSAVFFFFAAKRLARSHAYIVKPYSKKRQVRPVPVENNKWSAARDR